MLARSYEAIDGSDLHRLLRTAEADLDRFFDRNAHLAEWRSRVFAIALVQGSAEHLLRGTRGIWDLDVIVCFDGPRSKQLRRPIVCWDWGSSKFGRCPYDPPAYTGRSVDVKYWVIPGDPDPAEALRQWLEDRLERAPDPARKRDLAQEPVVLLLPESRMGEVVWDPAMNPPAKQSTNDVRRRPVGLAPP